MSLAKRILSIWPILAILAVGAALRLWSIGFGLPYEYRWDEGFVIGISLRVARGNLNPHFFGYPSLIFYVQAVCYVLFYGICRLFGVMHSPEDVAMMRIADPTYLYLIARSITVIAAMGTIYVVYAIGRRAWGQRAGLLAAAFLAVAHLHVRDSHYGTTDVPATFLACLAVLYAVRAYKEQSGKLIAISGILAGLAASVKYPLAISIVPVFIARLLQGRGEGKRFPLAGLVKVGACALLAFAITSPFVLLDRQGFMRGFGGQVFHMQTGHGGIDQGPGWLFHLKWTIWCGLGGPFTIAAIAGTVIAVLRRKPVELIIFSFPIVFYAIVGSFHTHFTRYVLPVVPFAALGAAYLLDGVTESLTRRAGARVGIGALVVLSLLVMIPSARSAILQDWLRNRADTRLLAGTWIETHVPSNSSVALGRWVKPNLWPNKTAIDRYARLGRMDSIARSRFIRAGSRFPAVYDIVTMGFYDYENMDTYYDVGELVKRRVEYVVTGTYPNVHWVTPETFDRKLVAGGKYRLIKTFSPFSTPKPPPLDTDTIDGYFMPYSKYEGIDRPGPYIRIYRATALPPLKGEG